MSAQNTQTGLAGAKFIGYGEMGVCMAMQLVGMVMFTTIVTVGLLFTTRVSKYGMAMYRVGFKLSRVRQFIAKHDLPQHLRDGLMVSRRSGVLGRGGSALGGLAREEDSRHAAPAACTPVRVGFGSVWKAWPGRSRTAGRAVRGRVAAAQAFYLQTWLERANAVREDTVVQGMPRFLRARLLQPTTQRLLNRCHFFAQCGAEALPLIAEALFPVDKMPGACVCLHLVGRPRRGRIPATGHTDGVRARQARGPRRIANAPGDVRRKMQVPARPPLRVCAGVELCFEGEEAKCLWLVETGTVYGYNMQVRLLWGALGCSLLVCSLHLFGHISEA